MFDFSFKVIQWEGFVEEGALFSPVRDSFKADTWLLTRCFKNSSHTPGKDDGFLIQRCRSCVQLWLSRLGLKGAPLYSTALNDLVSIF